MSQLTVKHFFANHLGRTAAKGVWIILGAAVWAGIVCYGFSRLLQYEAAPGTTAASVPGLWPEESSIPKPSGTPVLLLFAHPQCPCTRASISELEKLMTSLQGRVKAYVSFVRPAGFSEDKVKASLWKKAERIPGVTVSMDVQNQEASRFGASISGETYLYGSRGSLLFRGGITGGRGHEGENAGRNAVEDFILKGKTEKEQPHVFGCSLWDRETRKELGND